MTLYITVTTSNINYDKAIEKKMAFALAVCFSWPLRFLVRELCEDSAPLISESPCDV